MLYEDFIVLFSAYLPLYQERFSSAWYLLCVLSLNVFTAHLHAYKILLSALMLVNCLIKIYCILFVW